MLKRSIISLLILVSVHQLFGQLSDQQMFLKGVEAYKRQNYADARKLFFTTLKEYPNSRLQTSIKLMLAKSYDKLGDYSAANLVIEDFLVKYDQSNYLDDIHFLKGNIAYKKTEYTSAIEEWLWVVYKGRDSRLKNRAGNYTFRTMESYLTDSEISRLKQRYSDDIFVGLVEVVQAKKLINSGDREKGEYRLERFLDNYPYHFYADQVSQMLRNRRGSSITSNNILILKSGEEETREISNALTKGFLYAAYEMSQRDMTKSLIIDTLSVASNSLSMLHSTMDYIDQKNPLAIVGPLNDDGNTALALLSRYEYFPFISPLSSQKGLASLSPYGFQINPDAEIKGRFMAEYAVNELELETFATLAPADAYGISLVKGFEDVLMEYEIELVEKQWYYSDTEDFSRQFKTIRKRGFYITFRDSVESAIDTVMTEEEMQEQFQQYLTETLFSNEGRREIDSTQVPSTGIDALFIATYPEYIPFIAPQFAFQNIETQLLGNEGWNDKETLLQQRVYLDGLIYLSAGFFDPESWNYKAFQSRFRQMMQDTPGVYHLLGYDIGKWMITHYQTGVSRGTYREKLANSSTYEGILENIHFGIKPRVNSQLNIIKFYRGQILKVK
jgi:ABC-type branched-subunit amino acid transport system substrate-binding protein/outer membrane protein assembly factor BamD (BamD/ComL family)